MHAVKPPVPLCLRFLSLLLPTPLHTLHLLAAYSFVLDELEDGHGRVVALARQRPQHAAVAALAVPVPVRRPVEERRHQVLVVDPPAAAASAAASHREKKKGVSRGWMMID